MYERMKKFLMGAVHLVVAVLMTALVIIYATINAVMITGVLNDWRLDTYMGLDTGLSIILLLFMLVYVPAWALVKMAQR